MPLVAGRLAGARRGAAAVAGIALVGLCGACTVARNVRPVGRGQGAVGLSVGGPLFENLGAPIPVPETVAFGRYGLTQRTDVDIGLHVPVVRATGLDVGVAHLFLQPCGAVPAIMAGLRLTALGNGRFFTRATNPATGRGYAFAARIFEEIYATASWQVHPDWLVYGGLDAFAQAEHGRVRPSLYAGGQWHPLAFWTFSLEAKWFSFLTDSHNLATEYTTLGGRGALGVQLGAMYAFAWGGGA